jgi:membrane protease subunit (stomatin/prohibitin family)
VDMAGNQTKFSDTLKGVLEVAFADYGLQLTSFLVQSISLPEELQQHFDKMASMNMVGDLRRYANFQSADSIDEAAKSGGAAGAGIGMGAGLAMGQQMASAMSAGAGTGGNTPAEDPVAMISKLHELLTKGVLSQAEFDAKKAELLKKIT